MYIYDSCTYVCIYIYICMYVCICIFTYIYIHMFIIICIYMLYIYYIIYIYVYILFILFYFHFYLYYSIYIFLVLIANNLLHCFLSAKMQCVFFHLFYSFIYCATSQFGYAIQVVSYNLLQIIKYLQLQWLFCPPITLYIYFLF